MNLIKFSIMFNSDYHIGHLFAMNQRWAENQTWMMLDHPRQTSALLYFKNCAATYTLPDGERMHIQPGTLVYIPQGAMYKSRFHQCGDTAPHTKLLEFELLDENNEPFIAASTITVLNQSSTYDYSKIFNDIIALYGKPIRPYGLLKSKCYDFLNELCSSFRKERIYSKKYMPIAKGIAYLEQTNFYDLSIAEIANLCHVSESHFRKLFEQYSGVSPQQYKTNKMLRLAKDMIRSGDLTIKEISINLGFSDAGYFSRWFKKNAGITPSTFETATFNE